MEQISNVITSNVCKPITFAVYNTVRFSVLDPLVGGRRVFAYRLFESLYDNIRNQVNNNVKLKAYEKYKKFSIPYRAQDRAQDK